MRISIQKCKASGSASWIYRLRMKDNDRKRYEHTEQPNIQCNDLVDNNCDEGQPCWDTIRKVFCCASAGHFKRVPRLKYPQKHFQATNFSCDFSLVIVGQMRSRSMAQ